MSTVPNPLQLRHRAIQVLIRELGYVDAMRFLKQGYIGAGDYTAERYQFLPDWSVDELIRESRELQARLRQQATS